MNQPENLKRIGDVFTVSIGGTPSRKRAEFWDPKKETDNIWLSIRDISQNQDPLIMDSTEYISDEGVKNSNVKEIPANTALMTFKLTVGKTTVSGTNMFTNEAIAAFVPRTGIEADPYYVATVLPTLNYETDQAIKGITLNKAKIENTLIPLPKISRQKRIAEILGSIDRSISVTQKTIEQAEQLKKSLMRQLFIKGIGHTKFKQTEIGEIPQDWRIVNLPDISENLDNQRVPVTKSKRSKGQYSYYGATGIVDYVEDYLFDEKLLLISEDGANLKDRNYPIAFIASGKYWVNNHAHVLRFDNPILQTYIKNYFNQLNLETHLTGMAQPKLNKETMNKIPLPIPSSDTELQSIVEVLIVIDNQIEVNKKLKSKQEQLKQGLMQDLLTGKVAV